MATASETSKRGRIPPPINTELARDLKDYKQKTASPIVRELDRYPLACGRVEPQQRSSVSSIMNTTIGNSEVAPDGLFKLHAASDSISTNNLEKRIGKKLNKGQIQISSPEGFKHISGSGSQHFEEAILQRPDSSNSISITGRSPPPIPKPPSTKGPPVKSYRESMALRGVSPVIDPSAGFGHESRFSRALNSSQTHLQQHKQTTSSPVMSQRDSRRISRFPWKRPGERPDSPNSSFQISEPVLEYSTTELIHTTPPSTAKSNSISTDVYSPTPELDTNSSHAHTPTSSRSSSVSVQPMIQTKIASQQFSQRQLASSPVLQSPPPTARVESKPSPEYDYTHARQASRRSSDSLDGSINEETPSSEISYTKSTNKTTNAAQLYHNDVVYSAETPQQTAISQLHNTESVSDLRVNSEVLKWRQKCRESEEKRRALIVDYQQKLDAERKKNVDLEKKVEMMVREKAATAATFVTHTTSPKTIDLTNKVKALESQRRALKEALQNVRETKDLEIDEYRRLLIKLKARSQRQGDDASTGRESPTPSTSNLKKAQEFRPVRVGISPFLPTSLPVNFSQPSRDLAKR